MILNIEQWLPVTYRQQSSAVVAGGKVRWVIWRNGWLILFIQWI